MAKKKSKKEKKRQALVATLTTPPPDRRTRRSAAARERESWKVLYAVKVGGKGPGVVETLAQAAEAWGLERDDSLDLARFLIDDLKIGASAQERGVHYNSVVRAGNLIGVPMVPELRKMLKQAKAKVKEEPSSEVTRGRMRGLAQALTFVASPDTWMAATPSDRVRMVRRTESET